MTAPPPACPRAAPAAALPRGGAERALVLALRFVAAASETGDAACYEAAFAEAEAGFGPREGALVVARCAALLRAARREALPLALLAPPCRWLSPAEADILGRLGAARCGRTGVDGARLPGPVGLALADLAGPVARRSLGPFETTDWISSDQGPPQFPAILS